ncbi:hypothetical protein EDD86DRAFT_213325 [Gorgonomyces haynaldii]|nr:hypothetical protein EDD86DRAFT_213325 [Gorgonomyces haynaldii]
MQDCRVQGLDFASMTPRPARKPVNYTPSGAKQEDEGILKNQMVRSASNLSLTPSISSVKGKIYSPPRRETDSHIILQRSVNEVPQRSMTVSKSLRKTEKLSDTKEADGVFPETPTVKRSNTLRDLKRLGKDHLKDDSASIESAKSTREDASNRIKNALSELEALKQRNRLLEDKLKSAGIKDIVEDQKTEDKTRTWWQIKDLTAKIVGRIKDLRLEETEIEEQTIVGPEKAGEQSIETISQQSLESSQSPVTLQPDPLPVKVESTQVKQESVQVKQASLPTTVETLPTAVDQLPTRSETRETPSVEIQLRETIQKKPTKVQALLDTKSADPSIDLSSGQLEDQALKALNQTADMILTEIKREIKPKTSTLTLTEQQPLGDIKDDLMSIMDSFGF